MMLIGSRSWFTASGLTLYHDRKNAEPFEREQGEGPKKPEISYMSVQPLA